MPGVFDPEVYGEPVYSELLIAPETYGETPLAAGGIELGLISQTAAPFAPAVATGAVAISLGLIDQTAATFAPSIGAGVSLALIDQTAATSAPTVTSAATISLALLDRTAGLYAPTVGAQVVDVALIDQTAATFTPTTTSVASVLVALIDGTPAAFSPTVTATATISPALLDQTATPFTPTVVPGGVTVDLPLITRTATTSTPSVSTHISPALINQTATPFAPVVIPGPVFVALPRIIRAAATFSPTVAGPVILPLISRKAVPFAPRVSGGSILSATGLPVRIRYNNTDITADVDILTAIFTAQVNGGIGTCSFKVKDTGHNQSFIAGGDVTLDINGIRMWGGYLTRASRTYAFPVQDTTSGRDQTTPRYWSMSGVDYNVLFSKRIVFDAANPTEKLSWDYPVGTYDNVIINDIYDNYLDIDEDNLSRAGVTQVSVATIDIKGITSGKGTLTNGRGQIASAGYTWKQAMDVIARATGAVYYIDPSRVLHYVDVDTADASVGLSDQPGVGEIGYQGFNLNYNGTSLVNDMLLWGSALGSDTMVFSRAQNTTSQTSHGRWQAGMVSGGLYRQASADLVATSYLNGTPQSKRGGKDDSISLMCKVFEPVFNVGQKVNTEVNIFGYADVLPIRRQEIRFISPEEPVFSLVLGHDIDQPFGIYEMLIQGFSPPNFRIVKPVFDLPEFDPPEGGCTDAICGITDTFTRTLGSGWGTSDSGATWAASFTGTGPSVSGGTGIIGAGLNDGALMTLSAGPAGSFTLRTRFKFVTPAGIPIGANRVSCSFDFGGNKYVYLWVNNGAQGKVELGGGAGYVSVAKTNWADNSFYDMVLDWNVTTGALRLKLWNGGAEPAAWLLETVQTEALAAGLSDVGFENNAGSVGEYSWHVESIDISGVNRCTEYRFDNFNRPAGNGWGTSDYGNAWVVSNPATTTLDGTHGVISRTAGSGGQIAPPADVLDGQMAFRSPSWPTGTARILMDFRPGGTSSVGQNNVLLFFSEGFGVSLYRDGVEANVGFSWTANVDYRMRFYADLSVGRLKIWLASAAEPTSWTVQNTTPLSPGLDAPFFGLGNGGFYGTGLPFRIDWIDFDYTGKPCYQNCTSGPGLFVVAGDDGKVSTSPNGTTWTTRTSGFGTTSIRACAWSPALGLFIIGGFSGKVATSPDGITWTLRTSSFGADAIFSATWSPELGIFAIVGSSGKVATSPDGITWTLRDSTGTQYEAVAWSPSVGLFVLGGAGAALSSSPDGITWTQRNANFGSANIRDIVWGGNKFMAVGNAGTTSYSTDGINWTNTSPTGVLDTVTFTDVGWSGNLGLFAVMPGNATNIATTPDATTFTLRTSSFGADTPAAVEWSSALGLWVIGGTNGKLATSPDSVTWTLRTSGFGTSLIWTACYSENECTDVPQAAGGGLTGYLCETATRTDSTHYQLSSQVVPGTTEVYVNGAFQRPGIAREYTVTPTAGVILFNDPVTDGDVVRVCYTANGPI